MTRSREDRRATAAAPPKPPAAARYRVSVHLVNGPLSPSPEQYPPVVSWVLGQDGDHIEVRMALGDGQTHVSHAWWAAGQLHHDSGIVLDS